MNNVAVVVVFYFSSAFSTLHFCWVGSRSGCVSPLPLSPRLLTICQRGLNLYGRGPSRLMWLSVIPGHNRGWSCLHSCLLCTPQISTFFVFLTAISQIYSVHMIYECYWHYCLLDLYFAKSQLYFLLFHSIMIIFQFFYIHFGPVVLLLLTLCFYCGLDFFSSLCCCCNIVISPAGLVKRSIYLALLLSYNI